MILIVIDPFSSFKQYLAMTPLWPIPPAPILAASARPGPQAPIAIARYFPKIALQWTAIRMPVHLIQWPLISLLILFDLLLILMRLLRVRAVVQWVQVQVVGQRWV